MLLWYIGSVRLLRYYACGCFWRHLRTCARPGYRYGHSGTLCFDGWTRGGSDFLEILVWNTKTRSHENILSNAVYNALILSRIASTLLFCLEVCIFITSVWFQIEPPRVWTNCKLILGATFAKSRSQLCILAPAWFLFAKASPKWIPDV